MNRSPKITVCIVNWNGRHHLEYALPSLMGTRYSDMEVILVDNKSKDDSIEYVHKNFPLVRVIENESNLMWAGGNNVGIRVARRAGSDWIVLANNDILVDPRWAETGMEVASSDAAIGIIGYNVIGESVRTDVSKWRQACAEYAGLHFRDERAIAGCFMMVRGDVFDAIGLIDEAYGLYGEDNDFEARVVKAGFRVVRCNLPIWHCSEGTSTSVPLFSAYMATRNGLRCQLKLYGLNHWGMMKWFVRSMCAACDVRQPVDPENACSRRRHPCRNVLVNMSLVLRAFVWNLWHLRETRSAGRMDEERCAEIRKLHNVLKGKAV